MSDALTEARTALIDLDASMVGRSGGGTLLSTAIISARDALRALADEYEALVQGSAKLPQNSGVESPTPHDAKCEAEYVAEAPGWSPCGCDSRAQEVPDDALEVLTARAEAAEAERDQLREILSRDHAPDPHDADWWRRSAAFWAGEAEKHEAERDALAVKIAEALAVHPRGWPSEVSCACQVCRILSADPKEES